MTQEEFNGTNWSRGNTVKLDNGKEYYVKGVKKRYLLLYSEEYDSYFVVDHRIIECRTSDYVEPYVEKPKPVVQETPKETKRVVEVKEVVAPEPVAKAEPEAAEPAPEKPKRKRVRITVRRAQKVEIK